jgi:LacI family transcriptional regulator
VSDNDNKSYLDYVLKIFRLAVLTREGVFLFFYLSDFANMNGVIRIKDIAKMAQVSVGTVDRVIHKRGEVSDEAYRKVMNILEKTGYKPNLIARTLGTHKTFSIAAVLPDPHQDEYWKMASEGILKAEKNWSQYGVTIKKLSFDLYDKDSFRKCFKSAIKIAPDAVLTAPIYYQEASEFFKVCKSKKIPFAVFNNNIPKAGSLTFIGQDLFQSGMVGAELLHLDQVQAGTYAILHIYDDVHNSLHLSEKERGFKSYFKNIKDQKCKVLSVDLNVSHEPTLEKELTQLLNTPDLKGIVITTSRGASIVSKLLEKHGKNGIRLVAYDLLEENIHYLKKGIIDFLINQNSNRQAFTGITQLANYLVFKKDLEPNYLFPLEIITRSNLESHQRWVDHLF